METERECRIILLAAAEKQEQDTGGGKTKIQREIHKGKITRGKLAIPTPKNH